MIRDDATQAQVDAAQPGRSTWLSANAGSGKTRVLTDRVARLLLEGVQPQHILCLTYTKAAASEMQNRLFKRLGAWAMLDDERLSSALQDLGLSVQNQSLSLRNARTLFARAIEAPGGLKIQTIHSFCSALLRRFPLESGVSPQFAEMEDRAAALIRAEILQDIASGPNSGLLHQIARHFTGDDFETLTGAITRNRIGFSQQLTRSEIMQCFDLPPDYDSKTLLSEVFLGGEDSALARLIALMQTGSPTDIKNAAKLQAVQAGTLSALPTLEAVFLTGEKAKQPFSAKIGSVPTKKLQTSNPELMDQIEPLMLRVEDSRNRRLALMAAEKSVALHDFANVFLPAYEQRKQQRGWLDFDDLIFKARDLLTNRSVAEWVLYRLDGGIDHILVDEAQDTSPAQWNVIELLAQEFTSGLGARADTPRTIFVVGDKKQSIYSFQGADPREFDRMKGEFAQRLSATNSPLQDMELAYSFRSAKSVLNLVDQVFADRTTSGFDDGGNHKAFKERMPGRVDLWPLVETINNPDEEDDWDTPVDRPGAHHHNVILANRIAAQIKVMIENQVTIPAEIGNSGEYQRRPVQPGDFLILVQRRSPLFHEIIRACKEAQLEIAGADRLKVGAELAVRDLAALMSFLATPEDDYSLAVALKSPLFGWTEQQLFTLAHDRGQTYLWQALRARRDLHPQTLSIIDDLRKDTDFLRPYDLLERVLTRHDGRRKLLARLGAEAEDGINAFLSQALSYERSTVPSLTGFLVWMETDELEIKRQMDSAGNRIRVMTVHGAKGLESPIVILPDTAQRNLTYKDQIIDLNGKPMWKPASGDMPAALNPAMENWRDSQRAERDRLLYVGLTRAEKWLIIAASGELGKDGESWFEKVKAGMERAGALPHAFPFGAGHRLQSGDWQNAPVVQPSESIVKPVTIPAYFYDSCTSVALRKTPLSPSDLGGAKALPGQGQEEEAAKRHGRLIHRLLEHLPTAPAATWPDLAQTLLTHGEDIADPSEHDALLTEATQCLTTPALAPVFDPNALAEVDITAHLDPLNNRIHGTIDRLVITPETVTAVDFKTNMTVPETAAQVPESILRQMGAYAHALARIFPDRQIKTAVLWTRTANLMHLSHDQITEALHRAAQP